MPHAIARDKYEYAAEQVAVGVWQVDPDRGVVLGRSRRPIGKAHSRGYVSLGVNINGRRVGVFAHRVIWESVHGPIDEPLVINHINGDKTDNRLVNLEVISQCENVEHARRIGLTRDSGISNSRAALTAEQVRRVRSAHAAGADVASIAVQQAVSTTTVRRVIRGERYQDAV